MADRLVPTCCCGCVHCKICDGYPMAITPDGGFMSADFFPIRAYSVGYFRRNGPLFNAASRATEKNSFRYQTSAPNSEDNKSCIYEVEDTTTKDPADDLFASAGIYDFGLLVHSSSLARLDYPLPDQDPTVTLQRSFNVYSFDGVSQWAPSTGYSASDRVYNDGRVYSAKVGHVSSPASEPPNTSFWTDVGTIQDNSSFVSVLNQKALYIVTSCVDPLVVNKESSLEYQRASGLSTDDDALVDEAQARITSLSYPATVEIALSDCGCCPKLVAELTRVGVPYNDGGTFYQDFSFNIENATSASYVITDSGGGTVGGGVILLDSDGNATGSDRIPQLGDVTLTANRSADAFCAAQFVSDTLTYI